MQTVISRDGTRIAFEKMGHGPALIIGGGSLADHRFYTPLAAELSRHFTVYNFDRRGRGQSDDTGVYEVEREVEDVAALIAEARQPVYLYGHSAGSALALQAAAAGLDITKLALADPPYSPRGNNDEAARAAHAEQATRIQEMNDRGDYKASAKFFLSDYGLSDDDLEGLFQSPGGQSMIECARALPYDYALLGDGLVPVDLAAGVTVPTVIFAAEAMPETAQALADAMPNAQLQTLEDSVHETPPAIMAEKLTAFLTS